mgnify:FL=1
MAKKKQRYQVPPASKDNVAKGWSNPNTKKLFKQIGIFSIAAQVFFYLLSQLGAGYQLFNYMFLSTGRFDDLRNGIVQNKYFFSPELLDIKGFASVASPPMIFMWRIYEFFVRTESALLVSLIFTFLVLVLVIWLATRDVYATIFLSTMHPILFAFARANRTFPISRA